MHAAVHQVELDHISNGKGKKVVVETLSHSPRVYLLYNFMDNSEAEQVTSTTYTSTVQPCILVCCENKKLNLLLALHCATL
jgi:hypothetical protein